VKTDPTQLSRQIFTVSELTSEIKVLLEQKYSMIWISGEISNMRIPSSGHAYFSLKDAKAQISGVMFRGQFRQLTFAMENGQSIVGLGRVSVYEPRGTYQVILEYVEPKGIGALQIAFEQLKQKLIQEGLFEKRHKKALPFLPRSIAVVTAPTGAVIQDMLNVLGRRFPNLPVDVYPVRVQGDDADLEIVRAIERVNRLAQNDIILLARGGGSLEDLAAFNSEALARAIYGSDLPVVSAVGHETDVTIADFVADLRAATPSVAAEIIAPVKNELTARCRELERRCARAMALVVNGLREKTARLKRSLLHPGKKLQDTQIHTDFLTGQLQKNMADCMEIGKVRLGRANLMLAHANPGSHINIYRAQVDAMTYKLYNILLNLLSKNKEKLSGADALLTALNPANILKRGYSITRSLPRKKILSSASSASPGQLVEIQLAKGHFEAVVRNIRDT
jgi:exodeoxyribonuclease VII large subunit